MKTLLLILAVLLAGIMLYVRMAPAKPADWHGLSGETGLGDFPRRGGHVHRFAGAPEALQRLDAIARATPRTGVLTGGPETGMTTYVTRSRLFGFPDYTTVALSGGVIEIHARLRFGESDLGVNRARVMAWLAQL